MKKLILSLTVAAFAFAVQAGDAKADKEQPSCCAAKAAKAECKEAKEAKATCTAGEKQACKQKPQQQALLSPKAAGERK